MQNEFLFKQFVFLFLDSDLVLDFGELFLEEGCLLSELVLHVLAADALELAAELLVLGLPC